MTGSAVDIAAKQVKEKALTTAAYLLEANQQDLVLANGRIHVSGSPGGPSVTLGEVAIARRSRPDLGEADLSAEGLFEADHMTYPYGLHTAVVAVDTETGGVQR